MKIFKNFILIIFFNILLISSLNSKEVPNSFADLVEKLTPSVVNISATRVVETRSQNPFPFQFPPGHPFEDLFKDFDRGGSPQKRKSQALGSGFIIDKAGIINPIIAKISPPTLNFCSDKSFIEFNIFFIPPGKIV